MRCQPTPLSLHVLHSRGELRHAHVRRLTHEHVFPVSGPPTRARAPYRAGVDDATKATVQKLPMLTIKAGPRDGDDWIKRMKEEYTALIQVVGAPPLQIPAHSSHTTAAHLRPQYQKVNKETGNEWFAIESNKTGTRWTGKVWCMHEMRKYEFDLEFELPVAYPSVRSWRNATSPRTAGTNLCSHHIRTCPLPLRRGHVSAGSPGAGVARAGRQD